MNKIIREPAVAGQFYSGEKEELDLEVSNFLAQAKMENLPGEIKAIIVPHAGYIYSGQVAAAAFKQLAPKKFETIILIGNSHSAYFDGVAIDESSAWRTPLGEVEINQEFAEKLKNENKIFQIKREPHLLEHCLEAELPFLQKTLGNNFKILPILFGNSGEDDYNKVALALSKNLGKNDLVVISTDLSHYPAYEDAQEIDQKTLAIISSGSIGDLEEHIVKTEAREIDNEKTLICGIDGVKTVLELAKLKKWQKSKILKYANSGDTIYGDKQQVVGYGAVVFNKL